MGPVVGLQLVDNVLDMKIHRRLGDAELIGDLLVLVALADQLQHLELARRQILLAQAWRNGATDGGMSFGIEVQ